jgi:hypothetical protein
MAEIDLPRTSLAESPQKAIARVLAHVSTKSRSSEKTALSTASRISAASTGHDALLSTVVFEPLVCNACLHHSIYLYANLSPLSAVAFRGPEDDRCFKRAAACEPVVQRCDRDAADDAFQLCGVILHPHWRIGPASCDLHPGAACRHGFRCCTAGKSAACRETVPSLLPLQEWLGR